MAHVYLSAEVGARLEDVLARGIYVSGKDVVINGIATRFEEYGTPAKFIDIRTIFNANAANQKVPLALYTGMLVITPEGIFHSIPSLRTDKLPDVREDILTEVSRLALQQFDHFPDVSPIEQAQDKVGQLQVVENFFTIHERSTPMSGSFLITKSVIRWEVRTAGNHAKFEADLRPLVFFPIDADQLGQKAWDRVKLLQECLTHLTPGLGVEKIEEPAASEIN